MSMNLFRCVDITMARQGYASTSVDPPLNSYSPCVTYPTIPPSLAPSATPLHDMYQGHFNYLAVTKLRGNQDITFSPISSQI